MAKLPPNPINELLPKATTKTKSKNSKGATVVTSTTGDTTTSSLYTSNSFRTQGWYITAGIVSAVMLSNVPVLGPALLGILGIALIVQIGLLAQGK